MEDSYCTTLTGEETSFFVSFLETGWIYDVFLILTDKIQFQYQEGEFRKIPAQYCGKETIDEKTFSKFTASYCFEQASNFMVYFFICTINGVTYRTEPVCFDVKDMPEYKYPKI